MTEYGRGTKLIKGSSPPSEEIKPLTNPIYQTTAFLFDSAEEVQRYAEGRSNAYLYSRYENPTSLAVASTIAELEGAAAALLFSSGMAATATTLLTFLKSGDEIVCSTDVYGGTTLLLSSLLERLGVQVRFVAPKELCEPEKILSSSSRLVWFESPANPTLRCLDVRAIARTCRKKKILSVVDNTFATPLNQQPLVFGVDLCMHSASKYLNGHSDVTAGVIAGRDELVDQVRTTRKLLGTVLDPVAAHALGRGLKTLEVRVERHNKNAMEVARFLDGDSRVKSVLYPGLPAHPDYELAVAQMSGFGGVVCLELDGGLDRVSRFFDQLGIFKRAVSLGGVESLCSLPVLTSHWGQSSESLRRAGVTAGMARLSVGLEDVQDLIADLDQALDLN